MAKVLLALSGSVSTTTAGATTYEALTNGDLDITNTTELQRQVPFRVAGTLTKLYVRVSANTTSVNSTYRLRKNTADGNLNVTITNATTGVFEDTSNSDTVASGDLICCKSVSGGTGTYSRDSVSVIFEATTNTVTVNGFANFTIAGASTTNVYGIGGHVGGSLPTNETFMQYDVRKAGTLRNLYLRVSANARTNNTVFRSRKNGANGAMSVTVGSTATGMFEDTTNSDTIAVGDDINLNSVTLTGTNTLTVNGIFGVHYETTTSDAPMTQSCRGDGVSVAGGATNWYHVTGSLSSITTEAKSKIKAREAFTFNNLTARLSSNAATASSTITFRKNGADGNQSLSIATGVSGLFQDTTNSDTVAATDDVNYQLVAGGSFNLVMSFIGVNTNISAGGTNFDRPLSTETISISESITEIYGANRAPTAETVAISETRARLLAASRALTAETITIGESTARVFGVVRTQTAETVTIGESLARIYNAIRAPATETVSISEAIAKVQVLVRALSAETTAISESLVRQIGKVKALSDTVIISEAIARVFVGVRTLTAETTAVSESLVRLKAAFRTLTTETVPISESLARVFGVVRTLSDTTAISESLTRVLGAIRVLTTETISVSESLAKVQTLIRSLSDTTIISEIITRLQTLTRVLSTEINAISESLTKVYTPIAGVTFSRPLAVQTVAISESLARVTSNVRSIIETTVIGESLTRLFNGIRVLAAQTTAISESLAAGKVLLKTLATETITISESLSKVVQMVRSLSDNTIISETMTRAQVLRRALTTEISNISDSLSAVTGAFEQALTEVITITDNLITAFLHITKGPPLYLRSIAKVEGIGEKTRAWARETESFIRHAADKLFTRRYATNKRSRFG